MYYNIGYIMNNMFKVIAILFMYDDIYMWQEIVTVKIKLIVV